MTRQVPAASWALMGKLPGDMDDYRVLAGTSPAPGDLARRVWAGVPSTPQLGSVPGPGQLPWATFTPQGTAGDRRLAVTAIDATQNRDAVGRPTIQVRHMEVPFTEVARNQAGYQALYRAVPVVAEMAEMAETDEALVVDLGVPDHAAVRVLADDACFDRAAGLAALLLGGEVLVMVSEQDPPSLADRLAEFDRVLALLPFGLRAAIALASWSDGTQAAAFRIAFGKFATRGQAVAADGGPVSPPSDQRAAGYLHKLVTLRDQFGVEQLVEHLALYRAPLGSDDLTEATEILASLGHPGLVVEAARSGAPSVERVANARRHAPDRLDRESLDELEAYLLTCGAAAEPEVHAGWSARSAPLAGRIALGGSAEQAARLYAYAAKHDAVDSFLAAIAEGRTRRGEAVPHRTAARLVREFAQPAGGDLPILRQTVLRRPDLARWLLRLSLRRDPDPGAWLAWLDPSAAEAPAWLCRFAVLATPPGTPVPLPAGLAAEDGTEDLALIASFVLRQGSFTALADQWWPALLRLARAQPDDPVGAQGRNDVLDLVTADRRSAPDLPTAVRLDTLRLCLELAPRHYPLAAGASSAQRYLDALWELWSGPLAGDDLPALVGRLLTTVLATADPSGEAAITLLVAVVADRRIPLTKPVADAIAGILAATPALCEDPRLPADWWTRVERLRPGLRTFPARLRAAVRRPDADPVEIAVLCGRAAASGLGPEDLAALTGTWLASLTTAQASAMFRILEGVLRLAAIDQGRSYDEYLLALAPRFRVAPEKRSRRERPPR